MDKLIANLPTFHDGVFWFALVGCTGAAFKHFFQAPKALRDLSPAAFDANGKLHPAGQWWGGYAFGIMNAGFGSIGALAAYKQSKDGKEGFMFGTAVLFGLFAASWVKHGEVTGKTDLKKHAFKMSMFAALFAAGFLSSVRS